MASQEYIFDSIFKFSDDEFFNLNESILTEREWDLLDIDFMGVEVAAPSVINCNKRVIFPVVILIRCDGERDWAINLKKNCFLVASNITSGENFIIRPLISEREELYSAYDDEEDENKNSNGQPPSDLPEASALIMMLNAREEFPIDWKSGNWAFNLLYYDWKSNSKIIELMGDETKELEFAPLIDPDPNPDSKKELPSYVKLSRTPEVPDFGVSFHIELEKKNGDEKLILFASYSTIPHTNHITESDFIEFTYGQKEQVAAVIPLTVILVNKNIELPMQINLSVPVYGVPPAVNEKITGYCALELISASNLNGLNKGEYFCYILMYGNAYGPQKFILHD